MAEILWRRDPAVVAPRARIWRRVWVVLGVLYVATCVIAVVNDGPWGILGAAILFGLFAILLALLYLGYHKDMHAAVEYADGRLELRSLHRSDVAVADVVDYSIEIRRAMGWSTVVRFDLRDESTTSHTLVAGYVPTSESERTALDAALAQFLQ